MPYRVEFSPRADRDFDALPRHVKAPVKARIDALAVNPRPHGVERMSGESDVYRVRSGTYRIVYQIRDRVLTVLLLKIGHRREVYR
jgi:mRNA interferase RelE/StbE